MRCLLVDDEPGIREGLAALLRLRGYEVHTAADCAAAKALLATVAFDLVLTDWRLPDGTGEDLYGLGAAPIAAISGHPEEVVPSPRLCAVLQKPVDPQRLFALLADHRQRLAGDAPSAPVDAASLPLDVRQAIERAAALLGDRPLDIRDDGVFVTLRAEWPGDRWQARFQQLGGDLRVLAPEGQPVLELRWCRDGRPEADLRVVAATTPWPDDREFAVDFHDSDVDAATLAAMNERAAVMRRRGVQVWFLNVPAGPRAALAGDATPLPLPPRIGPSVPALLAALWR